MKTSVARRAVFLLPLVAFALYGCPQEETHNEGEEYADVLLEGDVTDEAMVALGGSLDQKEPGTDPARTPVLDSPTDAELPKSPIPTFTWHFGEQASFRSSPALPTRLTLLPSAPTPPSWTAELTALLGPPRAAHAHGDPLSGPATYLVFSTAADAKLVRVFTTLTTYTPAQSIWDKMVGAGAEITLSLVAADFDANRIADGGDPVQGSKVTFTIAP